MRISFGDERCELDQRGRVTSAPLGRGVEWKELRGFFGSCEADELGIWVMSMRGYKGDIPINALTMLISLATLLRRSSQRASSSPVAGASTDKLSVSSSSSYSPSASFFSFSISRTSDGSRE